MKSLEELKALKEKAKANMGVRGDDRDNIRIVVGVATCGIAAGSKPVLAAFTEEVAKRNLQNVAVVQTGCVGICQFEPVVEVYAPGQEKVTYVNMTPEVVSKIVSEHIVNGNPVISQTIGAITK